jgi:hypothetical protein
MGKVRGHIPDDAAALAQWVMRKVKNHDPMSQREAAGRNVSGMTPVLGRAKTKKTERVQHTEGTTEVLYTLDDGRAFKIEVTAVG